MTEINVDELIAEARWVADEHEGAEWESDAIAMIHRLADALVQVQGSADEWWKQYDAERVQREMADAYRAEVERDEWASRMMEFATAQQTLAKVREWAEGIGKWDYDSAAAARIRAILDESPTERETPANREDVARVLRDADRPDVPAHLPPSRKYADMATALMERFTITDGGGSRWTRLALT